MNTEFKFNSASPREAAPGEIIRYNDIPSKGDAKKMIAKYQNHPNRLLINEDETLRGLILDKSDLDLLPKDADKYMILFGVDFEGSKTDNRGEQYITAILAGVKNNEILHCSLVNKFKPCPDHCLGIEASYNRLFISADPIPPIPICPPK